MRKLVVALSLTSVTFAGSTAYFAHQLSVERERAAAAPARVAATLRPTPPAPGRPEAVPPAPATAASSPAAPGNGLSGVPGIVGISGQSLSEADIKKMRAEYSRSVLARIADPERNEEMLAELKMMMRNSFPRVDQVIGLTAEEYAKFIELSARQQMDLQEASARCMVDPNCRMNEQFVGHADPRQREIDELLGPERVRKLETYRNTMGEREAISQLRNRLPDAQRLSDANAELLIAALAEERDLIHREAAQRGTGVNSFSMGAGMVFAAGEGGTFEERYESARRHSQRLRDRAAQFLSPEQMRAFNEMQDETLITLRSALRHKDGMIESSVAIAAPIR